MPPEAKTVVLKDFDLSKIEEYFHFAAFERKVSSRKVHMIAHAIMDNKFTDNVLRVVPGSGSAKYDVLAIAVSSDEKFQIYPALNWINEESGVYPSASITCHPKGRPAVNSS